MQHDLDRRFLLGGLAGAAGVSALAAMTKAGPLNPPAGAVTSTGKTLTDVEPRTAVNSTNTPAGGGFMHVINASGSYYLAADVISAGGNYGIVINAPRVTLDLNGFSLINGGTGPVGIMLNAADQSVTIRNGTISGWSQVGIAYAAASATAIHLEDLILKNSPRAIRIPGPLRVSRCIARNCSLLGFEATTANALFESCLAEGCTGAGFYLNPHSVAHGCSANACGTGFVAGDGSRLSDCSATANTSLGFDLGAAVLLERCTARANGSGNNAGNANIRAGVRAHIANCLSDGGAYRGIITSHASIIRDCVVSTNSGTGVETGDGCTVERCNISDNGANGLQVATNCRVINNVIDYHAAANAAALRCAGLNNTVEQNQLSRAAVGVDMTNSSNNIVLNNRVSCTTPFVVNFGGNWYPQIPASSTGTTTTPFVNVVY
jgi:parallel beta-helix repeat protein